MRSGDSFWQGAVSTFECDKRLAPYEVKACAAHVRMLREAGAINSEHADRIIEALQDIGEELDTGCLAVEGNYADVHSWLEDILRSRVGELASTIRLGRGLNDLMVTDLRLWMLDELKALKGYYRKLQRALLTQAENNKDCFLPGYSHLRRAQPILLAHHLLAHFWALERDVRRLERCRDEVDCCVLGAGTLAGSSWKVMPERTAELLGFSQWFSNSLDAVSDRDFAVEFLAAASIGMIHLSRLAEDVVLWTSSEFNFAELPPLLSGDKLWGMGRRLCGPDPAESVRGRCGRVVGNLMSLLLTLKGLPLAYNQDLQEDKPPVFASADTLRSSLEVMAHVVESLSFNKEVMAKACDDAGLLAPDLADCLVRQGMPVSEAQDLAGRSITGDVNALEEDLVDECRLNVNESLKERSHPGAAGYASVSLQLEAAHLELDGD